MNLPDHHEDNRPAEIIRASTAMVLGTVTSVAVVWGALSFWGAGSVPVIHTAPSGATPPTAAAAAFANNRVMVFPDDATTTGRATIALGTATNPDPSSPPWDIGDTDFTISFWVQGNTTDNPTTGANCNSAVYDGTNTNIIIDQDVVGANEPGYIVGFRDGRASLSVKDTDGDLYTICTDSNVLDGTWNHVQFSWRLSDGAMWAFLDGTLEESVASTSVASDISYPDTRTDDDPDRFLTLGNEKGQVESLQFIGRMDGLHLSRTLRDTVSFTVDPQVQAVSDRFTAALWNFEDGCAGDVTWMWEGIPSDTTDWSTDLNLGSNVTCPIDTTSPVDWRPSTTFAETEWATSTGTSMAAISDSSGTYPLDFYRGLASDLNAGRDCGTPGPWEVVATSTEGFTTTNYIIQRTYYQCVGGSAREDWNELGWAPDGGSAFAELANPDGRICARWQMINEYQVDTLVDAVNHGDEWWGAREPHLWNDEYTPGDANWGYRFGEIGHYRPDSNQYPLQIGVLYTFEHCAIRASTTTFDLRARFWKGAGYSARLLYNSDDFTLNGAGVTSIIDDGPFTNQGEGNFTQTDPLSTPGSFRGAKRGNSGILSMATDGSMDNIITTRYALWGYYSHWGTPSAIPN